MQRNSTDNLEKITVYHVIERGRTSVDGYRRYQWESYKTNEHYGEVAKRWCTSPLGHVGSPCVFCNQEVGDDTTV